jgi:hypothetical protein
MISKTYLLLSGDPINADDPSGMKIRLMGSESNRKLLKGRLEKLTKHKLIIKKIKKKNKKSYKYFISIKSNAGAKAKWKNGNKLIKRLVDSKKTCAIFTQAAAGSYEEDMNVENATNGKGSNTRVYLNPSFKPKVLVYNGNKLRVESRACPNFIMLGHELIHADRSMRGVSLPLDKNTFYSFIGTNGKLQIGLASIDELATVGIQGIESNDITENQLRKEHNYRIRIAY